jgi:hypothetical protein
MLQYYSPDAKDRVTLNLGLLVLRLMVHVKKINYNIVNVSKKVFSTPMN